MKSRVFNICQYENNPENGESLNFSEDNIKAGLTHKSIKQWAYICHDKDVYTETEEIKSEYKVAGEKKPRHWHVVLRADNCIEVSVIARWFNVPENMIDVPKGRGAFLDCVEYLTHERCAEEKHRYEDSEVKANFDFRKEIDTKNTNRLKYGHDLNSTEKLRFAVLYEGLTLKQAYNEDSYIYGKNYKKLSADRAEYLSRFANPPEARVNYYIYGKGGIGKDLLARAFAQSLYPELESDEAYFIVGQDGAIFEGYDGQPVIIWSDFRASSLINKLGGRSAVFNAFDTFPAKAKQRMNVKYGSVALVNSVNIVTGPQEYVEFLDGLAGEYTDKRGEKHKAENKEQSYRRFPVIIPINEEYFDIMFNTGYYEKNNDYLIYQKYCRVAGNMAKAMAECGGKQYEVIEKHMTDKLDGAHENLLEKINEKAEDFLPEFEHYGEEIETDKSERFF